MKVLLKQAVILDPTSQFHRSRKDIFIVDGVIKSIEDAIDTAADHVINSANLHASNGWMDVFAHFCDPGLEHKETLETGAQAAITGGFTTVMVLPNTKPIVDTKTQASYIVQKSTQLAISIIPIGAITKGTDGKELAEMYDMQQAGSVAFSDGLNTVQSSGLLVKALQYVKAFDGVVIQIPDDKTITPHGLINEGIVSTRLGLPGKPMMAEELIVARDIKLARYADSKIHFTGVTSPKSIEYIKRAKEAGLKVTCSVTPYHLFFCDEDLMEYDTNLKVNPPLRTKADMMSLRIAVADGTIDCIATHHIPQDYDAKVLEFEYAKNGMIGLESCYSVLKTAMPQVSEERWIELLSTNAKNIFAQKQPTIKVGAEANISFFDPTVIYTFDKQHIRSKCSNSPFIGKNLQGKVLGVVHKNVVHINP